MFKLHSPSGGGRRLGLGVATAAVLLAVAAPAAQASPFAYVTDWDDAVYQYDVGAGGLLAPLSPFTVPTGVRWHPTGVVVSPDRNSVYVANTGGLGGNPDDVQASVGQYDRGADGTLSPKSPPSVTSCGSTSQELAVSPDGKSVYVPTGSDCTRVYQYDIGLGGELSPKSPAFVDVDDNGDPWGVVVSPDSESVYVTDVSGVLQFDVGPGGELSPKSPPAVAAGHSPDAVAMTPDGKSAYVVVGNDVSQYDVGAGGVLIPKRPPTVPAGIQPRHLAVSPDGTSAYVVNRGNYLSNGSVSQYDINPVSGTLSPKIPPTVPTGVGPGRIAVSPGGQSVYVTNYFDRNVSQYTVGEGGGLTAKHPATVAAGPSPVGIALSPPASGPTTKDQCKQGGWKQFGFKKKGRCIRFVKRKAREGGRAKQGARAEGRG